MNNYKIPILSKYIQELNPDSIILARKSICECIQFLSKEGWENAYQKMENKYNIQEESQMEILKKFLDCLVNCNSPLEKVDQNTLKGFNYCSNVLVNRLLCQVIRFAI